MTSNESVLCSPVASVKMASGGSTLTRWFLMLDCVFACGWLDTAHWNAVQQLHKPTGNCVLMRRCQIFRRVNK